MIGYRKTHGKIGYQLRRLLDRCYPGARLLHTDEKKIRKELLTAASSMGQYYR